MSDAGFYWVFDCVLTMGVGVVHSLHEVMNPTLECGPSYVAGRADRHVEAGRLTGFDRVINRVNTHAIRHRIGTIGVAKRERGAFGIVAPHAKSSFTHFAEQSAALPTSVSVVQGSESSQSAWLNGQAPG